ncbi:MAG: RHS repeat-associated core domain-containing protein [Acidobacteriota bacterium]
MTATGPGGSGQTMAGLDGSFLLKLAGAAGDAISLEQEDCAGNTSGSALVTVPGQGVTLPPNPPEVAPPLDPTTATDFAEEVEFLTTGPNPIQTGVAPGTLSDRTVAVLRGRVLSLTGAPVPGVRITCHGHPEFGETLTRADGVFDLAVTGGDEVVVTYEKDGYLPLQRRLEAPWRDFAWAPDAVLTPIDPAVTTVSSNAGTQQVAVGTEVTDEDGTRCPILVMPAGTDAEMVLPDGTVQALPSANLRVTEFTVGPTGPDAMPADLPPTTAYTWAGEISADEAIVAGATEVRFSQPLIFHQENFLDIPVGEPVPAGYYDRQKAAWVGSDNGLVIEVLSVDGQGRAELDLDGSGQPAGATALAALGVTDAERIELAGRFALGTSLWRVPIPHLTPWDFNWPWEPPPDFELPPKDDDEGGDDSDDVDPNDPVDPEDENDPRNDPKEAEPDCTGGSVIECQNQILGESVAIPGTGMALHYTSDRTPGRRDGQILTVRVTGPTVPASLLRAEVTFQMAGQYLHRTFPPVPGQFLQLSWDGTNGYGQSLQGDRPVRILKRFCYGLAYSSGSSGDFERAWERFSEAGGNFGGIRRGTSEVCLDRNRETTLTALGVPATQWDARGIGLAGWTLTPHHTYNPDARSLYLGTGGRRTPQPFGVASRRAVGTGLFGSSGDFGPSELARVRRVRGMTLAPDGTLYLADASSNRVRAVSADGIITTFAGNGLRCEDRELGDTATECGNGGQAQQAPLSNPFDVAVEDDGSVLIVEGGNQCVRRVAPDGVISTVAGDCFDQFLDLAVDRPVSDVRDTETSAFACDGCPATSVRLRTPSGVQSIPGGGFWVTDSGNGMVLRVTPDGLIEREVGDPMATGLGDGGRARDAKLSLPRGMARDRMGNLYIADSGHHRVRKVSPSGVITTFAGDGSDSFSGEGGPAVSAGVPFPKDVSVRRDGTVLISASDRILSVGSDGRINTAVGGGTADPLVAGIPAANADFLSLWGVLETPLGTLSVADENLAAVFEVGEPLPGYDGDELRIPNPAGTEVYIFSRKGRHLRTIDSLTGAVLWEFGYDAQGRLVTVTDADGLVTTIERAGDVVLAIVGPYGHRTELGEDQNGWLSSVTTPAGRAQSFRYTEDGLLEEHTDARGNTSRYEYTETGHLKRAVNRAGTAKTLARFGLEEDYRVIQTSPTGLGTEYHVDRRGSGATVRTRTDPAGFPVTSYRLPDGRSEVISPDGTVTTTQASGDPRFGMSSAIISASTTTTPGGRTRNASHSRSVTLSDPLDPLSVTATADTMTVNGHSVTRIWEASTRTITMASPEGREVVLKVDDQRRPIETRIPGLLPVFIAYNDEGNLERVWQGVGDHRREIVFGYNDQGRVETVTDPMLRVTTLEYDDDGRPITQILPDGNFVSFRYNLDGNLTELTPPGRPTHKFQYTSDELPNLYTPPTLGGDLEASSMEFDEDRRLDAITRAGGLEIDLEYDVMGRLQTKSSPQDVLTYSYWSDTGRLKSIAGPRLGQEVFYTADGFLPTQTAWSGPVSGSVSRTFDDDFRVITESVNGGNTILLEYDDDGLLEKVGALDLQRSATTGFVKGATLGSVSTDTEYSPFGEVETWSAEFGGSELYRYEVISRDKAGRIIEAHEAIGGTTDVFIYGYSVVGRLETVSKNGVLLASYSYGPNGDRLTYDGPFGSVNSPTYDDQDRLTAYGGVSYTYLPSGELSSKSTGGATVQYGYNSFGDLRRVILPDGIEIEYILDGSGRRVGKKIEGSLVQGFLYGDLLRPVAELNGAGAIVSRFVYGERGNVPDYFTRGGSTYRMITDLRGSVRLVVNAATGVIEQRLDYDEYGRILQDSNPGFQPFGYAGGLYDHHTGWLHFGAREYVPSIGRWNARDPLLFGGRDSNLYAYVAGDPINFVDFSGTVKFRAENWNNVFRAYRLQEQLREQLKPETKEFFEQYGVDIDEVLSYCYDYEVDLVDTDLFRGKYNSEIFNELEIALGLSDELFQATLLHELVHWAADKATPFGSHKPQIAPSLLQTVESEILKEAPHNVSVQKHSKQPYAVEYLQFGSLVTLGGP